MMNIDCIVSLCIQSSHWLIWHTMCSQAIDYNYNWLYILSPTRTYIHTSSSWHNVLAKNGFVQRRLIIWSFYTQILPTGPSRDLFHIKKFLCNTNPGIQSSNDKNEWRSKDMSVNAWYTPDYACVFNACLRTRAHINHLIRPLCFCLVDLVD